MMDWACKKFQSINQSSLIGVSLVGGRSSAFKSKDGNWVLTGRGVGVGVGYAYNMGGWRRHMGWWRRSRDHWRKDQGSRGNNTGCRRNDRRCFCRDSRCWRKDFVDAVEGTGGMERFKVEDMFVFLLKCRWFSAFFSLAQRFFCGFWQALGCRC
ncbi:hypothetical protein ElyMa_000415700 [Elysia marginata]|uniref:Uncharacterized protein n=1 Tax=Elysia marginata TaxID=1093978 RepID=A0AAV4FKU3_9GAST|nr:hypothetical protein ElyMa_000415700 [Elysia marginata]